MLHRTSPAPRKSGIIILAATVIILEVLIISTQFDAATLKASSYSPLQWILSNSSFLIQWLSVATGAFAIIYFSSEQRPNIYSIEAPRNIPIILVSNLLLFSCFYSVTYLLFERSIESYFAFILISLLWFVAALGIGISALTLVQPIKSWLKVARELNSQLVISMLLATVVTSSSLLSKNLWPSVIAPTFYATEWLLSLFSENIIVIPDKLYLGLDYFVVHVSPTCSGVEGMGLATGFTVLYLYLFKEKLRFPHALVLLPLAATLSWIFNVVRIATLILLGRYVSEDFAVGGFHSQAGWFFFLFVVLLIIYLFHRIKWFKVPTSSFVIEQKIENELPFAILICFVWFSIGAFIAGFDQHPLNWLYPVKALLGFIPIVYYWRTLDLPKPSRVVESTVIGSAVFFLWIFLVPLDETFNEGQVKALEESSLSFQLLWVSIRVIGSVAIAPIIEELIFRSYLLSRISSVQIDHRANLPFTLSAVIISSLAFALIHQQWLAGFVAGLLYAIARFRGNISTAICSHAITNGMLCVYAIVFDYWSYL